MNKAVVTGGAGFIGSNLTQELLDQDWEVNIIDNFEAGKMSNVPLGAKIYQTDFYNFLKTSFMILII